MNKYKFFIVAMLLVFQQLQGQQIFISAGRIEYEKKINLRKQIEDDSWLANLKDQIPEFRTDYLYLYFKDDKTLFEKKEDNEQVIPLFDTDKSIDDIVFTDLSNQTFVKKENVFENVFLISDSIRKIDWRITNDTRTIAGFECRKAIGVILDTVYVIAFYTDEITVSGGPFSFCNLTGMILGIAIPRINMTCFATKLDLLNPTDKLTPPTGKKLKPINYVELNESLKKSMKDWGKWGQRYMINFLL